MFNQQDYQRWLLVRNESGTAAPAYAALLVIGYESGTGAVRTVRPTANDIDPGMVLINGPLPIAADAYGQATIADPALALVSGAPAIGAQVGTQTDAWDLAVGRYGFRSWMTSFGTGPGPVLVNAGYKAVVGVQCVGGNVIGTTLV